MTKNIHFPRVWKNDEEEKVAIIYWNRVEYYGGRESGRRVYRDVDGEKFDPFHEEEMVSESGFKRVHEPKDKVF